MEALRKELLTICWWMRGGVTLNEVYIMPPKDRALISEIIQSNMEATKETQMPFI